MIATRGIGRGSQGYVAAYGFGRGESIPAVITSSGARRLLRTKQEYRSIDWSAPVFGKITDKSEQIKVISSPVVETKEVSLSEIDKEIQQLINEITEKESLVAQLSATEERLQEQKMLEETILLKKRKLAMLLILM